MTDKDLIAAFEDGAFADPATVHCPCGVVLYETCDPAGTRTLAMTRAFHRRQENHDCVHHPRRSCGSCRIVDRTLAQIEARLRAEAEHGPFLVTE